MVSKHHNGNPDSPFSSGRYNSLEVGNEIVIFDVENYSEWIQSDYSIEIQKP
jgi:hypothetical protein